MANENLKNVRNRKYLARDFDSLRATLLEYARQYYPDKIRDFSESSLGGLFLDFAAYVGDNLSFYLDHQYGELNVNTAVETTNIERALRNSGVPIVGAAPALVPTTIYVEVPADQDNLTIPLEEAIPVIQRGSIFTADNGIDFTLIEDVNYASIDSNGNKKAEVKIGKVVNGVTKTYTMALAGLCISGKEATETITIGDTFVPFRKIKLSNPDISEILSVTDAEGNTYYQVSSLTQDVVYQNVLNTSVDSDLVKDAIKIIPAPYRFVANVDLSTRKTTLTFGGGSADTLEDDVIPDPSEFAIALPYTRTFTRVAVNPQSLLQTKTLGVATTNTQLTIAYRYGGGLSHNVAVDNIRTVKTLKISFPNNPTTAVANTVKNSVEVSNLVYASGGEDAPTADDLKSLVPTIVNSQERIVSREDLLARVYTLPSNFGRVFRAAVKSNAANPLATQLVVISRDANSNLIISPDTLKNNLSKYLNPYRMISDAIDIVDAKIVNLKLDFDVLIDPTLNRSTVLQAILKKLQSTFDIKNFNIDQPIILSDIINTIFSVKGVLSVNELQFTNMVGLVNNRQYSDVTFDVRANTSKSLLFPPHNAIFEIRYPEVDIVGRSSL